jgi:hypothetical protein
MRLDEADAVMMRAGCGRTAQGERVLFETIEEALGALASHQLEEAERSAKIRAESQREAERSLAGLRTKLGGG